MNHVIEITAGVLQEECSQKSVPFPKTPRTTKIAKQKASLKHKVASFVEKHQHIMPSFGFISLSCKTF